MKYRILLPLTLIVLATGSCRDNTATEPETREKQARQLAELYSTDRLDEQHFAIDPNRDTLLKGKHGTLIRISKNTFVDASGNPVTTPVDLALKEALKPEHIVFANLTTTSNGKPLQTGGMIWIGAGNEDGQLQIAGDKSIGVALPQDRLLENMKVYRGIGEDGQINWVQPNPILNATLDPPASVAKKTKRRRIRRTETNSVDEIDAIFGYIDSLPVTDATENSGDMTEPVFEKGWNKFQADPRSNYIFEMKPLGWANIDRLYEDPRTQEVELVTQIANAGNFKAVYITMVIKGMYLPGYQMKDGTFSFAHHDYEAQELPVGEKAIIFTTAYLNDEPYFDLARITIQPAQTIKLNLEKTTENALRKRLIQNL